MTTFRPDVSALTQLRCRTQNAITELAGLRSDDPAAARAMRTVRLCRHTLELFWLPAFDDLLQSPPETDRTTRV